MDSNLIVSDGELEAAQSSHEDGGHHLEELEKIEQINEDYRNDHRHGRPVTL